MLNKPDFINELDYKLLKEKYHGQAFVDIIEKIRCDYPVQYAIGDVEFLENRILVDERALIPRFETELLVDKVRKYVKEYALDESNMLDLCTGTGCIAIALKTKFQKSSVIAVDISSDAIDLAKANAKNNSVAVDFVQGNILEEMNFGQKFSVLISNPPYVRLDEEVSPNTKFEPSIALYPGEDELAFYKRILFLSKKILTEKALVAFEIGAGQGDEVRALARETYPDARVVLEKDYNQLDRFVFVFLHCE